MVKSLLIVDDDPAQRRILEETIKRLGFDTKSVSSGEQALQILEGQERGQFSLVLLDLVMDGIDGMAVLDRLSGKPGLPPIIVQTAHGSIDAAINAMRAGAVDFVVKPASPERLEVSIRSALKIEALAGEISRIKKKVEGTLTFDDLIVRGDGMERVVALGKRAAASNIPVLIEGESGVGKELIARAVQGQSERAGKPFVVVNCGAIPENLVESILFGHEKGSFTGASDKHLGKFQEADGGTLFLDEIGELRLDMQVKLLRALQEGEVDPVGSKRPVKVNVRIIAATNRDIGQMAREGTFREDLYYRLNVFPVLVPALRDRAGDIAPLARHFIERFAAEENKSVSGLTTQAGQLLDKFNWPGNVRQLENTIFRAVVLCDGQLLDVCDFPQIAAAMGVETVVRQNQASVAPMSGGHSAPALPTTSAFALNATDGGGHIRKFEDMESEIIRMAIARYDGHMSEVARRLGIGRSTLYRKLKEFGLEADLQNEPMAGLAQEDGAPIEDTVRKTG